MYCWIGFIPIPLINVGMEFPIPQNTINNVLLDWVHPHTIGMEFPIPPNTINNVLLDWVHPHTIN